MENTKAKELFDSQFKFKINDDVRHKGDSKGDSFSSDLGLLVLSRTLEEAADDDGNCHYLRIYVCRMIKFSGSGDLARFKESELMTMEEYNRKKIYDEQQREDMRNQMYASKKAIFASFGVQKGTEVYLKINEIVDKTKVYAVSGYSTGKDDGTYLILRMEAGEGKTCNEVRVKSKDEFELLQKEKDKQ